MSRQIKTLKWAEKMQEDILAAFNQRLDATPIEEIATNLMTNEQVAQAIIAGVVEMSLTQFLILCKMTGTDPSDLMNALGNNNVNLLKEAVNG